MDEQTTLLKNQNTLRLLVGFLGILLPLLLYVGLFTFTGYTKPLESISHYYYTRISGVFVIIISLLAIFLIVYRGKAMIDAILSMTAGIFALLLVLFPTNNIRGESVKYAVSILQNDNFRINLHYISAAIFLLSLSLISLFLFTKSNLPPESRTEQKKIRNKIYRICGITIIIALILVFINRGYSFNNHFTFWLEVIAIEAFGFAWVVKSEIILKDK